MLEKFIIYYYKKMEVYFKNRFPKRYEWTSIVKLGQNRIVKSSYFWFIIVPIVAKAFQELKSPLVINSNVSIVIELPFSWQLFYAGSVIITIANVLYSFYCPDIIKDFKDFSSFQKTGRTFEQLKQFSYEIGGNSHFDITKVESRLWDQYQPNKNKSFDRKNFNEDLDKEMKNLFWRLVSIGKKTYPIVRFLCWLLYRIGILMFIWVAIQNFLFIYYGVFLVKI